MANSVHIPSSLRQLTGDQAVVEVNALTVGDAINELQRRFPGFRERLLDDARLLRRFVNIYVNGEDIRFLQNLDTLLKQGDELTIIPAIAGG